MHELYWSDSTLKECHEEIFLGFGIDYMFTHVQAEEKIFEERLKSREAQNEMNDFWMWWVNLGKIEGTSFLLNSGGGFIWLLGLGE